MNQSILVIQVKVFHPLKLNINQQWLEVYYNGTSMDLGLKEKIC